MTPTERDLQQARELAILSGMPEGDDYAWIYQRGWTVGHHDAERQHAAALLAERRRMVTESVAALNVYREALLTLPLDPYNIDLINRVADAAVRAIRDVACICPMLDASRLGEGPGSSMVRGHDRLCGVHGKADL